MSLMPGFEPRYVRANGTRLHTWTGGAGTPVVLLHGYPQSGVMWRKVAPTLARSHTVVCPDLRGYGDSDKPRDGYDKKTMARDIHALMVALGHERYAVVGHDRGARVSHRLALDQPDAVTRLCLLDIVPTHTMFRDTGRELAATYWHWFFFQVPDLPEIMIANSAEPFLRFMFRGLTAIPGAIDEAAFQEYLRVFQIPGSIRAGLEDYRHAATTDFADDAADLERRVTCPTLAIWGELGKMHAIFDVLGTWRDKATDLRGHPLPCGHFIPEEAPERLLQDLQPFLAG
ncbi:MAG: alpha/beta hydrolase [Burkholderiales bacterium]|nr:alpha/beta hydrolase [Burkholderiales bacterium]